MALDMAFVHMTLKHRPWPRLPTAFEEPWSESHFIPAAGSERSKEAQPGPSSLDNPGFCPCDTNSTAIVVAFNDHVRAPKSFSNF